MKIVVQSVNLNDYEICKVQQIVPSLLKLGQGYRWSHMLGTEASVWFKIEKAMSDVIVVKGQLGGPKFRLGVKGHYVSFTTERAERPEFILYNFMHILASIDKDVHYILKPDFEALYDSMPTDSNSYYLANNEDTERLPEYFGRVFASKKAFTYISGMLNVNITIPTDGDEKARERIKEFAESSAYDEIALAAVFCRGEGVPIFYANGSIHCLLEKRALFESFIFDFSRTFMKNSSNKMKTKERVFTNVSEADYLRLNPGIGLDRLKLRK